MSKRTIQLYFPGCTVEQARTIDSPKSGACTFCKEMPQRGNGDILALFTFYFFKKCYSLNLFTYVLKTDIKINIPIFVAALVHYQFPEPKYKQAIPKWFR